MTGVLTLAVVSEAQHSAAANDTPHGVGVVDAAHEQFAFQKQPRWRMGNFLGVHKPRPMEPWVPTGGWGHKIRFDRGPQTWCN